VSRKKIRKAVVSSWNRSRGLDKRTMVRREVLSCSRRA